VVSEESRSTDSARQAVFVYVEVVRHTVEEPAAGGGSYRVSALYLQLNTDRIPVCDVCAEIGVGNASKCSTAKVRVSSSTESQL